MNSTPWDKNVNNNALSRLSCKIDDFDSEILKLIDADKKDSTGVYKKFIHKFLNYIPVDYRSNTRAKILSSFASEAYDFFKKVPNEEKKLDIQRTEFQNQDAINILIVEKNIPFVIDSLNILIAKLGLQTVFIFHPVIPSKRNEQGELLDVLDKYGSSDSESLIYIKALGSFSDDVIENIKKEISHTLSLVKETLVSWQSMLDKVTLLHNDIRNSKKQEKDSISQEETADFISWLQNNNITFLGVIDFNPKTLKITQQVGVGYLWKENVTELTNIINFSKNDHYSENDVMLGKINKISPIHRNVLIDYILIKQFDKNGKYIKATMILGLYGTAIYYQSIESIPILRQKMKFVLESSNFPVNGYNSKKIKNIIESLPRDILIQIDERDLYCMCVHMLSSMLSHKLKLFIQQDWSNSFINFIIFMPRERLSPDVHHNIIHYLSEKFASEVISDNITVVAQDFAHLFTTMAVKSQAKLDFSQEEIQHDLVQISNNWSDSLMQKFCEVFGEYEAGVKHKAIEQSFSNEYRYRFTATDVVEDLRYLQKASMNKKLVYNFIDKSDGNFYLKIYSSEKNLILSEILPPIENLGFVAVDEQSFFIKKSRLFNNSWLYEFKLSALGEINIPFDLLKSNVEEALEKISCQELASDTLGKLITLAGFNWVQIKLLKSLISYLHQTGFIYSKEYVQQTLAKHYRYSEMLFRLFEAIFSPDKKSQYEEKKLIDSMSGYLDEVDSSAEDKILTNVRMIIQAILRTNFYQKTKDGKYKNYFSFKLRSEKVPDLPLPIPYAEIFVYANEFEGIHLRGGKVARGGIRWSDRGEDYRREVLGLLKAQMTKNTIIVPIGSKGTFYVNFAQGSMTREEYLSKVVGCYQNFLRGLLDLTDNLVNNEIVQPAETIAYDDVNPYLVVAADKGTASFSDHANEVSKEYNFWLKDAFASGGSVGYDHKKMGITAKGGWISVVSHFQDKGIDVQKEPFTVVGIGDMSGDVFGNGMLLSEHIKLVAAFNHQHIFIDPDPDCKVSFKERKRLFDLPRSSWSDYNKKLLSKGGAIYPRSAKTLELSAQAQSLLDTEENNIPPEKLIRLILKSKVDLMWNGGIGTYIKASTENNIDIGDKTNDNLRVDGSEVRAQVVAEGGNLGVSQLGRVEFALNGGAINTDFIDNSAGVDCSDHEVNIKIALNLAINNKKISNEQRNQLLLKMTGQVEDLVLLDNHNQHLAITIASLSSAFNIESFTQLIKELERTKLLDSKVEFLPSKAELARRFGAGEGMTRPELAVLLSYSKMSLDFDLSDSPVLKDEHFEDDLLHYFPKTMQKDFKNEILTHPLRDDIVRTIITNKLVNRLGGVVVNAIKLNTGSSISEIVRAYEVVSKIFHLDSIWQEIVALECSVDLKVKIDMFTDLIKSMRRGISWFIRHSNGSINIEQAIKKYSAQVQELSLTMDSILIGSVRTKFFNRIKYYTDEGVNEPLATSVSILEVLISAFDIIYISNKTNKKTKDIAGLYFECGEKLSLDWLRHACEMQNNESYWNKLSIQSLKDDFYDKQKRLVQIVSLKASSVKLDEWLKQNMLCSSTFINFIEEIKIQETVDLNMIILANKKLEIAIRKLEEISE
ncbi:MAG TPA: NAD-glutamate dehydrogenase [Candidatus Megaira endosymbiont of Nemacystus decipiens]|nr:NAD-glutamate dehydrogenase [Candidatus Megaera endosymbiont of Nemacystus decipiens]